MKLPKELMFVYLLSLENYRESHPTLKDITMKEALEAHKDIIEMKSEELLLEYKIWRKDSGQ